MAVDASAELRRISLALRETGQRELRVEMQRTLRLQAAPAVSAVRAAARTQLPHSGGLAEEQASQKISVSVLGGARNAGVTIRTKTRGSMQTDDAYVRKPLFGDRKRWYRQELPRAGGWWSKTLAKLGPAQTAALVTTMKRIAKRCERGV